MNYEEVLSGNAGLAGIQSALNGPSSRRLLRREAQEMLRSGYRAGPFHLTRAKYKPGRKLLAYFTFPALDSSGQESYQVHLAAAWQKTADGANEADAWSQLQEEANQSGLMPVQRSLWKDIPDQGLKLEVWPFDLEFPRLIRLGNPSYVAQMLASLGIVQDRKETVVVTPIRYRPGERHVLRYKLSSPGKPRSEQVLYAKLYSNPENAARAFGVANRVVDWLVANDQGLKGNRPEAISQEDGVILYSHAPGIPLSHQLNRSPRWLAARLQIIGRALAILHNAPEGLQADLKQNNFVNEAKVVRRASEHIHVLLPETHQKILEIVDKAQEHYSSLPQEKPTFTHADFKADHLLSTPQGLTLIDFDTCTLTDPALDVGKFLADLDWWFARRGIPGVEEVQAELLKSYRGAGQSDLVMDDRLARAKLFHVLILVKIVARRVPLYDKNWARTTNQIIARAAEIL